MLPHPILRGWTQEKAQCAGVSVEAAEGIGTRRAQSSSDGRNRKTTKEGRHEKGTRTMDCFEEAEMPLHEHCVPPDRSAPKALGSRAKGRRGGGREGFHRLLTLVEKQLRKIHRDTRTSTTSAGAEEAGPNFR
jgi:hypothetical protein